jgi:hypothetical protein
MVFENKLLGGIIGPEGEEVTDGVKRIISSFIVVLLTSHY